MDVKLKGSGPLRPFSVKPGDPGVMPLAPTRRDVDNHKETS